MKALVLLLLRASTGLLLIIWGSIKFFKPEQGVKVSDYYYSGALSAEALQAPLGGAQMLLGLLVILGLLRIVIYPIQAIVLGVGLLAIWKYIADPFGMYLVDPENTRLLFFPSTTVFFASLAMLAFKDDDALALDRLFKR